MWGREVGERNDGRDGSGGQRGYLWKGGESRKARGGHGARYFFMLALSVFFSFLFSYLNGFFVSHGLVLFF